ncbi:MAG: hypothetical protein KF833_00270 [Verrucomicrobiae bacterium]|nr:hypothetical protein [Verrucomicrobiae bacterium]
MSTKTRYVLGGVGMGVIALALVVVGMAVGTGRESGTLHAVRWMEAVKAYGESMRQEGQEVPAEVTLSELIRRGFLSESDAGDLLGMEVTLRIHVDETQPGEVLAKVVLPDGSTVVALGDGSVQPMRR